MRNYDLLFRVTWPLNSPEGDISWDCGDAVGYDKVDMITGAKVRVGTNGETCKEQFENNLEAIFAISFKKSIVELIKCL